MYPTFSAGFEDQLHFDAFSSKDLVERGIPEVWADLIRQAGIQSLDDLAKANPNKLHNDLCGLNKKNKLGLTNPAKEDVIAWISQTEKTA